MHFVYRLDLKYIGSDFKGWQAQVSKNSVQDHIERALETLLREPVKVIGASRTDSGVHAEHQVAIFRYSRSFDKRGIGKMQKALNAVLPTSIGVMGMSLVPDNFHPITSSFAKLYCYRVWEGQPCDPFLVPFTWAYPFARLDHNIMSEQAQKFVGRHDYTAFCAADSNAKTRVREICGIEVQKHGPLFSIWILGRGFLKQMARSMAGTLVGISAGRFEGDIGEILASKDRSKAGMTAPACGLTLMKIFYEEPPPLHQYLDSANSYFRHEKPPERLR